MDRSRYVRWSAALPNLLTNLSSLSGSLEGLRRALGYSTSYKNASSLSESPSADQTVKRTRLYRVHATHGTHIPFEYRSNAVADGAIGFYCDHHVSARVSKFMYGVEYLRAYDSNNPEHVDREHRLFEMPSGPRLLPDAFDCILARVSLAFDSCARLYTDDIYLALQNYKVKESTVFSRKYCTEVTSLSMLSVFETEIWCYQGGNDIPKWFDRNHRKCFGHPSCCERT